MYYRLPYGRVASLSVSPLTKTCFSSEIIASIAHLLSRIYLHNSPDTFIQRQPQSSGIVPLVLYLTFGKSFFFTNRGLQYFFSSN